MAQQDAWRAYYELALGLTETSRKKALKIAKNVVSRGGASAEQLQTLAEDLVNASLANREAVGRMIKIELDRALGRVGLATMDEVEELMRRVRDLERELGKPGGPAGAAETPETAPAETPAKAVAKKTVAKKVLAPRAVAPRPEPEPPLTEPIGEILGVETFVSSVPKPAVKKTAAKKAPVSLTPFSDALAKQDAAEAAAVSAAKQAPAKKIVAKQAPAKKTAKQAPAKQAPAAKQAAVAKQAPPVKKSAKKAPAKKSGGKA